MFVCVYMNTHTHLHTRVCWCVCVCVGVKVGEAHLYCVYNISTKIQLIIFIDALTDHMPWNNSSNINPYLVLKEFELKAISKILSDKQGCLWNYLL